MSTVIMSICWPLQGMSPAQKSALITLAELRDTALIGSGMPYAERKANLLQYMQALQGKRLAGGRAA